VDGAWGPLSRGAIQKAVAKWQGYKGRTDGSLAGNGVGTCKAVQNFARYYGNYKGPVDGIPGANTWNGFRDALKSKIPSPYSLYGAIGAYISNNMSRVGPPINNEYSWWHRRAQNTQNGFAIVWTAATGTHFLHGAIGNYIINNISRTGFPLTNEYAVPGGMAQKTQYMTIYWNKSTGAITTEAGPQSPLWQSIANLAKANIGKKGCEINSL